MRHGAAAKVHMPGKIIGGVQKCIRCHTRMDSNRRWPNTEPVGWPVGKPVVSDRSGMSVIDHAEATQYRPCGRKPTARESAIEKINMYGEDGIAVALTADGDTCESKDDDCALLIIGHQAYASSVEEAHRSIRREFLAKNGNHPIARRIRNHHRQ